MLISVKDVAIVPVQKVGDGGDQPLLVGATNEQDSGTFHNENLNLSKKQR